MKFCFILYSQGLQLFNSISSVYTDPELRRLAGHIPLRVIESKAPSTVDRYSRAFNEFKCWASDYHEIVTLPSTSFSVSLYLEHIIEGNCPASKLDSAFYGIQWAHNVYGLDNPCNSGLVKNILEAGKRKLKKPIVKKEPITYDMMVKLCSKYAVDDSSVPNLRIAALCVTAFHGFLRFNELSNLRCCEVKFCTKDETKFVELYISQSKTDIYRDGAKVLLASTSDCCCPFDILLKYVKASSIDLCSKEPLFRNLQYSSSCKSYKLRSHGGMSYTRMREIVLEAFKSVGFTKENLGLHSLRSGGATAAANAGVNDRLFKRHGRWRSETAKDGYVKDSLDSLLSVSRSLSK